MDEFRRDETSIGHEGPTDNVNDVTTSSLDCGNIEAQMERVGVRELKTHLSRHLERVRRGAHLAVTLRGRVVATIAPVRPGPDDSWARRLVAEGRAQWDGGKPSGCARPLPVARGRTVAAAVLEDRR
jgi:antitoxin (DNA-binding transcriptional repressor) of toxin-antitoxin stability system